MYGSEIESSRITTTTMKFGLLLITTVKLGPLSFEFINAKSVAFSTKMFALHELSKRQYTQITKLQRKLENK
jgi:hypothetical protein